VDITYKGLLTNVLGAWGSNNTSTDSGEKAVETGLAKRTECVKGEKEIGPREGSVIKV